LESAVIAIVIRCLFNNHKQHILEKSDNTELFRIPLPNAFKTASINEKGVTESGNPFS
jgi:hypothetical protein